jgi:hypothetical protein
MHGTTNIKDKQCSLIPGGIAFCFTYHVSIAFRRELGRNQDRDMPAL